MPPICLIQTWSTFFDMNYSFDLLFVLFSCCFFYYFSFFVVFISSLFWCLPRGKNGSDPHYGHMNTLFRAFSFIFRCKQIAAQFAKSLWFRSVRRLWLIWKAVEKSKFRDNCMAFKILFRISLGMLRLICINGAHFSIFVYMIWSLNAGMAFRNITDHECSRC